MYPEGQIKVVFLRSYHLFMYNFIEPPFFTHRYPFTSIFLYSNFSLFVLLTEVKTIDSFVKNGSENTESRHGHRV